MVIKFAIKVPDYGKPAHKMGELVKVLSTSVEQKRQDKKIDLVRHFVNFAMDFWIIIPNKYPGQGSSWVKWLLVAMLF